MKQANSDDGWWRFLNLCTQLKSAEELDNVLQLFLTIEEKKAVSDRYLVIYDLLKGERTQRQMAEELQVSIAKITRGSNSLKTIDETLRGLLTDTMT